MLAISCVSVKIVPEVPENLSFSLCIICSWWEGVMGVVFTRHVDTQRSPPSASN
jgi:hypothetical protein